MTGRPVKLVDAAGRVHFEGTDQAPGGGSQPYTPRLIVFPFTFATPNLLTGVTVWTPSIGDYLLDAWFDGDPDDIFDAPSAFPKADIGRISAGAWVDSGWFSSGNVPGPVDLSSLNLSTVGGSVLSSLGASLVPSLSSLAAWAAASANVVGAPITPRPMTTADPVKLVVSGDGTPGGADPESTQGSVKLVLHVAEAA